MDEPSFGAELRRRRLGAGLSLAALAKRLHYSKGYLSKIETGSKRPGPELARRCDGMLAAGGELAGIAQRAAARPSGAPGELDGDDDWSLGMMANDAGEAHGVGRRHVLVGGAASLFAVSPATPGLAAVAGEESTAAGFTALFAQLRALGQDRPSALVLPTLVVQVHALDALAGAARPAGRPRLLMLAARFAEYTGWMVQEAGDDRAMAWWTAQAVRYAQAAGDQELAAYAHVRRANVAMYRDDGATAIELAGQAFAQAGAGSPRIRGLALQRQAQGYALVGQQDACLQALDAARDEFARIDEPSSAATVLGTATVFDPDDLVLGWCLHDLGRSEAAIPVLERHLTRVPPGARRARSRAAGRLALAQAAAGEPDAACRTAGALLDDAVHLDAATLRHDLRALARTLNRWRIRPAVQALSPRLTDALRVTRV